MAQAQLNAIKVDKLDTPTYTPRSPSYNPKFSPPQSQDAFGLEMGHYDHRSRACMDREDFGILTTTMDGIITAMNCMSDQINNHSTLVVNELKDQREKNLKFIEKVDKKLLEMKKDLQKILKEDKKENEEDKEGRTKQTLLIMKDQRESTVMLDKKLREMTERIDKWERSDDSFRHNLTGQVKEDHQKIVSAIEALLKKLQEEREQEETAAAQEPKKKGACFICSDSGHYAPDCPNKKEKKPAAPYKGGPSGYYQRGATNTGYQKSPYFQKPRQDGPTIAERKQNSNCYHCGQQGHWASDCPIKDIPAYDQEFWSDIDSLIAKENEAPPQPVQQETQPMEFQQVLQPVPPAIQPLPPTPKKRKLSLKKKDQQ